MSLVNWQAYWTNRVLISDHSQGTIVVEAVLWFLKHSRRTSLVINDAGFVPLQSIWWSGVSKEVEIVVQRSHILCPEHWCPQ